ncbi:acid phosphatase type 7 [Pycnococcus provasolii]
MAGKLVGQQCLALLLPLLCLGVCLVDAARHRSALKRDSFQVPVQGSSTSYVRTPSWKSQTLAQTDARLAANPDSRVEQVHLAILNDSGMFTLSWVTPRDNPKPYDAVVAYCSPAPCTPGSTTANATTTSYKSHKYQSDLIQHTTVGPFAPNTEVSYSIANGAFANTFKTPPLSKTYPQHVVVVGDLGQTENSVNTLNAMEQSAYGQPSVVFHVGDLSYADGDQPRWDAWGRMKQPLSSAVPWMTVEGNHEIEFGVGGIGKQFVAYNARFRMPSPGALWYAFTYGDVRFVMLGSYDDYTPDSPQYRWLSAELASINRDETPFVIVGLHAPWYNSNHAHQGEGDAMKAAMEKLLLDARVDALFAGHVHAYERTHPVVANGVVDEKCGIPYIVIGDGGNREGLAKDYITPTPEWSAFREASYGFGTIDVVNATHAHFQWIRSDPDGSDASDSTWIISKDARGCS